MAGGLRYEITLWIEEQSRKGFIWGENDCALFANDMLVKFFNFPDVGAKFRGKYSDFKSAKIYLRSLGYKNIADIAEQHCEQISHPEIGAVALDPRDNALGVCLGPWCYFLGTKGVLIKYPSKLIERMWRYKP